MQSLDTNILFNAFAGESILRQSAVAWMQSLVDRDDVVLSELVLVEFYRLLRNPTVLADPLTAPEATTLINTYRRHPRWRIVGLPAKSRELHDELYACMARSNVAYRRIYDTRLALSLRAVGVTDFATTNKKDFQGFGFDRVWNPLTK